MYFACLVAFSLFFFLFFFVCAKQKCIKASISSTSFKNNLIFNQWYIIIYMNTTRIIGVRADY